jgi:hypothetical protein
LGHRV